MIDAKDFRLNNLVQTSYEGVLIVQGIAPDWICACKEIGLPTGWYSLGSVFPVELSEEWVLRLGFNKTWLDNGDTMRCWDYENSEFHIHSLYDNIFVFMNRKINTIHHLQNLFHALTLKELTIQP